MLLHGDLILLDEGLLEQAVLLVILANAAHDHLLDDILGLAGILGVLLGLDHQDLLLLVQGGLIHVALVQESGVHGADLHGHILAHLDDLGHVSDALHGQVHQHADLAAHVDIGHIDALGIADEAADLDVLPDGEHLVGGDGGDGAVGAGVGHLLECGHIGGVLGGDDGGHVLDKALEHLVLGHEVGLGVDLHHDAHASLIDDGVGDALGGHLAGLLGLGGKALLTQPLDSLVLVAVSGGQRLLAVHHAHASHLAQGLYVFRGKSHLYYLHKI